MHSVCAVYTNETKRTLTLYKRQVIFHLFYTKCIFDKIRGSQKYSSSFIQSQFSVAKKILKRQVYSFHASKTQRRVFFLSRYTRIYSKSCKLSFLFFNWRNPAFRRLLVLCRYSFLTRRIRRPTHHIRRFSLQNEIITIFNYFSRWEPQMCG